MPPMLVRDGSWAMAGRSKSGDRQDNVTVSFGARFARSDQFKAVFREGMALVESAATYLDGDGRKEARKLRPPHSLAYATESMRLTTRLMQLASWLLIRRAVSEGELTPEQAKEEQRKIKLPVTGSEPPAREFESLPPRLRELIEQSIKLQERVIRLDQMLGQETLLQSGEGDHPLKTQLSRLRAAFGKTSE
jgi:regulator of CtrA degradation